MQPVTALDPTAGLKDLAPVDAADAATFVAAYEESQASSSIQFFPRLHYYSRRRSHQLRWERHSDSLLVYQFSRRQAGWRMSLYLPPLPFDAAALRVGLERLADYNGERAGRIIWVPEGEALTITRAGLSLRFKADEYIFDRAAVLAAEGSDFRSLRQEISRAERAGAETRPYRAGDRAACVALVENWKARNTADDARLSGYSETIACLAHADRFSAPLLRGMVVEVDGAIRGFAFSGHLAGTMGCNFLCITDRKYHGLPHLLRCRLMAEFPEYATFNDSTDAGRPGLQHLKNRFRPVRMLGQFTARED